MDLEEGVGRVSFGELELDESFTSCYVILCANMAVVVCANMAVVVCANIAIIVCANMAVVGCDEVEGKTDEF